MCRPRAHALAATVMATVCGPRPDGRGLVGLDGCEVRLCDPCARVSRVCPGSPRCLFTVSKTPGSDVILSSQVKSDNQTEAYRMCSGGQQWWKGVGGDVVI